MAVGSRGLVARFGAGAPEVTPEVVAESVPVGSVGRAESRPAVSDAGVLDAVAVGAFNATTGAAYRGGNIMRLAIACAENGYSEGGGWAGFAQWLGAGRVVRKGEHGTACMTVVTVEGKSGNRETRPRGFRVFHRDQTDELEQVAS